MREGKGPTRLPTKADTTIISDSWVPLLLLLVGMDWNDLDQLIKDEKQAGNPVAQLIHSLQVSAQ
jgi:hypothetical protein